MICFGGSSRLGPRAALLAGLGLALPLALAEPLGAQDKPAAAPAQNDKSGKLDALKQHDDELKATRDAQRKSADTEAALKREIEQIGADRRKLNQALLDTAARTRGVEAKVEATQARLAPLDENRRSIEKSLDGRRAVIGEVLAALQRIGHRAPPALISSPEDALQAVRTAMVLGAVLPEMRHRVEALANDLNALLTVRKKIADERDQLNNEVASLNTERDRMAALIAERQKQEAERVTALDAERARAADLAKVADNLKDLITQLEQGLDPATRAAREEAIRNAARPALAALHDPGRLGPAVAFASLHGRIPIPVNGVKLKDFGAPDSVGSLEKGVSIATRAGAQVTSPADGWVVYAGPFRSYGQLLILNAGGGYHILLAGMDKISVDLGQFVLTGEPVAVMGTDSHIAAI
ncbi:MAG TPA: peptidoglycan DD-metalloendopeptidase family protein, partial [Xanthobacteraceae bacterium]|nr:peptidoglycan DD-metalloendopeptidase family protein [Xanthobacteraceae bacterium]